MSAVTAHDWKRRVDAMLAAPRRYWTREDLDAFLALGPLTMKGTVYRFGRVSFSGRGLVAALFSPDLAADKHAAQRLHQVLRLKAVDGEAGDDAHGGRRVLLGEQIEQPGAEHEADRPRVIVEHANLVGIQFKRLVRHLLALLGVKLTKVGESRAGRKGGA